MNYTLEEIANYREERALLVQKVGRLNLALIKEPDESRKFAYEQDIKELENRRADIDKILAEACNLGTPIGQEQLREKIRNLRISEPMGRLHLVNCNRQDVRDRFEEGFDRRKAINAQNHFYFLSACPRQLPPSLGERMVYELLGELLDEGKNAVYCRFNPIDHDRVKLEKLPLGYSAEKSQALFQEFCADWFAWENNLSLEEAIAANRLPLAKHEYSVLPFYLHKKDWKPFFATYFEWVITRLAARPSGGPTLLVFVVLYIDELHEYYDKVSGRVSDPKAAAIIDSVNEICTKHPTIAGHYYPLEPVEASDVVNWFNDLGEMNNARIQPVIDTLVNSLTPEEVAQYRRLKNNPGEPPEEARLLNMDRVELVQEIVFDLYNK